jgi:hypothetical protein
MSNSHKSPQKNENDNVVPLAGVVDVHEVSPVKVGSRVLVAYMVTTGAGKKLAVIPKDSSGIKEAVEELQQSNSLPIDLAITTEARGFLISVGDQYSNPANYTCFGLVLPEVDDNINSELKGKVLDLYALASDCSVCVFRLS